MVDIIIRGGMVADGTGKSMYPADVAVQDGKITAIGDLSSLCAAKELNAHRLVVAPGFIDSHAHSDTSFLIDSSGASKLYQGVTTEVSGQCGSSPFPSRAGDLDGTLRHAESFDAFIRKFEESDCCMAVNQALLTGHGSLRAAVVGYEDRPATEEEIKTMQSLLRRDLEAGSWGMSLGLEYSPGFFAGPGELKALGTIVRECDGFIPCHMRSEGLKIDEAIEELLDISRASGARVHISHLKLDNYQVHGRAREVWERIESARREGVRVTADMYPFTASCTSLSIRCPKWSREGGDEALTQRLTGPRRSEIVEGIRTHYFNADRAETCLINDDAGFWPEIVGKTLRFIAHEYLHTDDYAEAAAEILIRTHGQAGGIFFVMSGEDMLYFLSKDVGIGSDGWAFPADESKLTSRPHPRSYAALTEFFRLAREKHLYPIEETVRRVTSMPAAMLGIKARGTLSVGAAADITVFNPDTIAPRSTYLNPIQLSCGVVHVLVNGGIALENGVQTDYRGGRFLRKNR